MSKKKKREKKGTRMVSRANKFESMHACIDRLVVRIRSRSDAPVPNKIEKEKSGVHVEQHECRAATLNAS
jgi:hypothetical protein